MRTLVRRAMEEGALGVASALIYPPGSFAKTDELIALSEVAAEYDGVYISHMRDEGAHMLEAIEELLTIAREAKIRAEIYHLKSAGRSNWPLFDEAVARSNVPGPMDCRSRPTSTPMRRVAPGSTQQFQHGSRKVVLRLRWSA